MARKLERVRKFRKKDFDKMVEALFKLPPPKKEKEERSLSDLSKSRQKEKQRGKKINLV